MPNQTVQSSAVNVLQCGCLGSWNTAQFARKMCALITWSAAGIAMKPFAVIAVGFVVGKIEVIKFIYIYLYNVSATFAHVGGT